MFPVQPPRLTPLSVELGAPRAIPWALAERAYAAYCRLFGNDQSMETLAARAGFGPEEIDCLLGGCNPFFWQNHTDDVVRKLRAAWVTS